MQKPATSGALLIADYQAAMVSRATSESANYEAQRSETEVRDQLSTLASGSYLNPRAITSAQDDIARSSLDAHVKQVQAEQLKSFSAQQLADLIARNTTAYKGRKVTATSLNRFADSPFDAIWYDNRSGYRNSIYKRLKVTGIIEEVLLDRNILTIRPVAASRLLNKDLKQFVIYVIDPKTFEPAISLIM